jgi:hypothetical protein
MDRIYRDLHSLAGDFFRCIAKAGVSYGDKHEYGFAQNSLAIRSEYAWVQYASSPPPNDATLPQGHFAATLVLFRAANGLRKIAPEGRPELWFVGGRVAAREKLEQKLKDALIYLAVKIDGPFEPDLTVGGGVSFYRSVSADHEEEVCAIGYELGEISSIDDLRTNVAEPLIAALRGRKLLPA